MSWEQQQTLERERWDEEFGRATAVDSRVEKTMGLIAKDTGGGDFKMVPPGTHLARAYRIVDLGTQEGDFSGEKKFQLKLMIGWELFGEDDDGNPLQTDEGMPLVISKRYTNSLHKKANLRADLEAWRGKPFADEELKGFSVTNLADKWCLLSVIHNSKGEKAYANVASLSGIPKSMKGSMPKGVHEIEIFNLDEPDMAIFEKFHDKLKETIQASLEWRAQRGEPARQLATAGGADDLDDDIPFANPYRGKLSYVV